MPAPSHNHGPRLEGVVRHVDAWFCSTCGAVECGHVGYVNDRRDPDHGRALCVLNCGHLAIGNRLAAARRGRASLRCLLCVPGEWVVHARERDRARVAEERATARAKDRLRRIEESVAEAMAAPPPYRPSPIALRRPHVALLA